jgi:Flp pilus assembly protein TadG
MNSGHHAFGSERGAVLVHVAAAILALMALSIFVVDYGVLWASRRQAQNVADAAALAGAVSFAYDSKDVSSSGPAALAAQAVVQSGSVWGQVPIADVLVGDAASGACPAGQSGICVRVDVHRDTAKGNPLPTFFGAFVGRSQQSIRATATAIAAVANATDCLKPWGVIDKWAEHYPIDPGTWSVTSTFDKYLTRGPNAGTVDPTIPNPDVYIPPSATDPGTGFRPFLADGITHSSDYGLELNLTVGDKTDFSYATGWFAPLALFDSRGGNDYNLNIKGCLGVVYKVGDQIPVDTEPGLKVGPTRQAVATDADSLINQDPGAYWDTATGTVKGSAFANSPRIVAVPLVNPDDMTQVHKGGRTSVPIENIMGFFVERYDTGTKAVVGRLVTIPGMMVGGGSSVGPESGFMQAIILIR